MPASLLRIETHRDLHPGGGIVGVCAAYWLARAGQNVLLIEKGRIGVRNKSSKRWHHRSVACGTGCRGRTA
ncbi:FAD-dependent oxidoreductase [Aquicoccus sp.]|uniref:FAD-dependent oxidoreductase n=1 Tax=Aquicoccus sp. TaxID=2055851 RepID=UPI003561739D